MAQYREFKVIRIAESGCSTVFLGQATLPLRTIEETLNRHAAEGWQVVFMITERSRFLLFWSREAMVVTLGR